MSAGTGDTSSLGRELGGSQDGGTEIITGYERAREGVEEEIQMPSEKLR